MNWIEGTYRNSYTWQTFLWPKVVYRSNNRDLWLAESSALCTILPFFVISTPRETIQKDQNIGIHKSLDPQGEYKQITNVYSDQE